MPPFNPFIKEVIKASVEKKSGIKWAALLYSNADGMRDEFEKLIGPKNVFYLQDRLNEWMKGEDAGIDSLADFPASIFECLATSKVVSGHIPLARKSREYQQKIISGTYRIYKEFLLASKPDFVFFPVPELYDSVVLYHLCRELDIGIAIYAHARNLGCSYFSDSIYEELPAYIRKAVLPQELKDEAANFILSFREEFRGPGDHIYEPLREEILPMPGRDRNIFKKTVAYIGKRLPVNFGPKTAYEPHLADTYTLFHRLSIHFLPITLKYRELRGNINKKYYDVNRIEDLPKKFIYYPLQYSPEISINVPAPFFIDQLRAIDLILNSIPPDHFLVVKEHPAMIGIRSSLFYKELRRRACVLLANSAIPSFEVTKCAALTISVTGTACLESFLLGWPSLHIGRAFFTDWIYSFDSFSGFGTMIREAIEQKKSAMDNIVDLVSRVFLAGDDFLLFSPMCPYQNYELIMNRRNVCKFLDNLIKYTQRLQACNKEERQKT